MDFQRVRAKFFSILCLSTVSISSVHQALYLGRFKKQCSIDSVMLQSSHSPLWWQPVLWRCSFNLQWKIIWKRMLEYFLETFPSNWFLAVVSQNVLYFDSSPVFALIVSHLLLLFTFLLHLAFPCHYLCVFLRQLKVCFVRLRCPSFARVSAFLFPGIPICAGISSVRKGGFGGLNPPLMGAAGRLMQCEVYLDRR